MCGLVAAIAKKQLGFYNVEKDIFKEMLYADAVRGKDATGVFGVNKTGNLTWLKQACASGWFICTKEYEKFSNTIATNLHMIVGHNRKATHGDKKDADAHPFIKEHITLVHNGMISNHKDLCKTSTVDSNAVANALAESSKIDDVINKLTGAFALIWYNGKEKKLYFIRNQQRPLYIVETDNCWYLASESMLAGWIITRNNQKVNTHYLCEENKLYSIDLDKKTLEKRDLEEKKVTPVYQLPHVVDRSYHGYGWGIEDTDDGEESLFLTPTTTDRSTLFWARVNQKIVIEVTDFDDYYNEQEEKFVRVEGRLINTNLKGPHVVTYVPLKEMDHIVENNFITVKVKHVTHNSISYNARIIGEYINTPLYQETMNNIVVTNDMWVSPLFPANCEVCKSSINFTLLKDCEVYIEDKPIVTTVSCTCPSCLEKETKCTAAS